ncbi:hypothetical protein ACOMHN_033583 [Nucella lapillus]
MKGLLGRSIRRETGKQVFLQCHLTVGVWCPARSDQSVMANFNRFSYGDSGQGNYGEYFGPTSRAVVELAKDGILEALDFIPINAKEDAPFTIADYGAADGFATMALIKELIGTIRKNHGAIPIQIVYGDQASSDFNSLFRRVHGLIPDPCHYIKDFGQVYVMASGASFYEQILPGNSAHLIMSVMAAHYSSKPAVKFHNSQDCYPDATQAERQLAKAQMTKDWETFLLRRAAELKSGGVLFVSTPTHDPEMNLGGVRHSAQGIMEAQLKVWRQMRDEGKITQEEFVDTNFYRYIAHLEEVKDPFKDPQSKVMKAGLRLLRAERVLIPCILKKAWQEKLDKEGVDDRAAWAKGVVGQHKCWSEHAFIRGLASTRSQHEREALVHELFERVEKEILAQGPREFRNEVLMNNTFVRKIQAHKL